MSIMKKSILSIIFMLMTISILSGCINNSNIEGILTNAYEHEQVVSNELVEYLIIKLKDGTNITCNRWEEEASQIVLNEDNFRKNVSLTFETEIILKIVNMDKYLIEAKLI